MAAGLGDVAAQYVSPARLMVDAQVGFNLLLAIVFLPLIGPLTLLVAFMVPDKRAAIDTGPRHLDEDALSDLASALAAATWKTLRIGHQVENIFRVTLQALILILDQAGMLRESRLRKTAGS